MNHQWRLLLLHRRSHRPFLTHYRQFQVISNSTRSFSSFLHQRSEIKQCLLYSRPPFMSSVSRSFSSEPAIGEKPSPESFVIDVFTRLNDKNEIKKELISNDIVITHEFALKLLRSLESNPDFAKRFFNWVLETSPKILSSKSYNTMLRILGVNGLTDEFWRLVDAMKKKGHGVSANVRDKVSEKFQKDDLIKLKELFASGSMDNSVDKVCNRVCKIVMKENQWSNEVEKQLRELKLDFDSELVKMVIEKLDLDPRKALLFFRWINESSASFKHDEKTYNAMARVLGKEKYLDRFRNLIEEIRVSGYEMEMETYVRVSSRFCQCRMVKEAVELFEFAMSGSSNNNTPTAHCCSLLLKKIVASKNFDMDLFSRTVKAYTGGNSNNVVTDSMLQHVLKSLRSVDRFGESNEVLKTMKETGYVPNGDLQSLIASGLSQKDEANELVSFMEASKDHKAMASLIERHCDNKNLQEALVCFKKMIGEVSYSGSYSGYAFEKLILAYCNAFKAREAYKVFVEVSNGNDRFKPWHSSYKIMIRNLLMKKVAKEGGFEEALSLLPMMMKIHGFPPFVDPFLEYLLNFGTSGEALGFLKAVSLKKKKFPSNVMVLRVFEAMLKGSSRYSESQDLLSLCPSYIRRNSDVLELFRSVKMEKVCLEKKPLPDLAQIEALIRYKRF